MVEKGICKKENEVTDHRAKSGLTRVENFHVKDTVAGSCDYYFRRIASVIDHRISLEQKRNLNQNEDCEIEIKALESAELNVYIKVTHILTT